MPTNTPNHGYTNWAMGESDWQHNDDMQALDTDVEIRDTDTNKSNYTAKQGAKYLATDTGQIYLGDGTNWVSEWDLGAIGNSGISDPASTINVPSDEPTVASALNHILDNYATIGHTVTINIETGHEIQEGFTHREKRPLSHVEITSEDEEVFISDNVGAGANLFGFYYTYSPVFDIILNGNGWNGNSKYDGRLFYFRDGAVGLFNPVGTPPIAGGKNADYGVSGLACSTVIGRGTIWENMTERGVSISNSSWGYFQESTLTNCDKAFRIDAAQLHCSLTTMTGGTHGLWISSPSIIAANDIDASDNYNGIRAQSGAIVQSNGSTINNCTGAALYAREGSTIAARGLSSDGCNHALEATHGSTITLEDGTASITNTTYESVVSNQGSFVYLSGTVDSAGRQGVRCYNNSKVDINGDITNSTYQGVEVKWGGKVNIQGSVTGSGGAGDIEVTNGSIVSFGDGDTTTTASTGTVPHENDMSVTPNTIQGAGIIFAENFESA